MTVWILARVVENLTHQISTLEVEYPQNKRYSLPEARSSLINTIFPCIFESSPASKERRRHMKILASNNDCCIVLKKFLSYRKSHGTANLRQIFITSNTYALLLTTNPFKGFSLLTVTLNVYIRKRFPKCTYTFGSSVFTSLCGRS